MAHGCGCRRPGCPECGIPEPVYLDAVGAGGRAGMTDERPPGVYEMMELQAASQRAMRDIYAAADPLASIPAEAREPLAAYLDMRFRVEDALVIEEGVGRALWDEAAANARALRASGVYKHLPALAAALRKGEGSGGVTKAWESCDECKSAERTEALNDWAARLSTMAEARDFYLPLMLRYEIAEAIVHELEASR